MRGAEYWIDHNIVRSKIKLVLLPDQRRQSPKRSLNTKALNDPTPTNLFREKLANEPLTQNSQSLKDQCRQLLSAMTKTAEDVVGFTKRRHQEWFDE